LSGIFGPRGIGLNSIAGSHYQNFLGTRAFLAGPAKTIPGGSGCWGGEGVISATASPVAGKKNIAGRWTEWPLTLADAMRRPCELIICDEMADRLLITLEEPQRLLEDL